MTLTDQLFTKFIYFNNLSAKARFGEGEVVYEGKDFPARDKNAILASDEFAGFCDGIQRKPHKYLGAKGSPKKDERPKILRGIQRVLDESMRKLPLEEEQEVRSFNIDASPIIDATSQSKY